ncbi:protein Rot1p [[Candida] jaroonii]|uniref:Protein Rot1p n=1 Tax=[Candida] jaroonii TaxID=467808 RepID=A0ACA9YCR7_9ASCO|nr:protein Rot1p [[Candida] jaroonii]
MSKSKTVITGPRIYDPIDELIFEPSLPGISYSFDDNGNWEQAIYQVSSNPIQPECPTASILWQHGKYTMNKDGSLTLNPYPSDGRKLFSDPCKVDESIYMRCNEIEKITKFVIEWDGYNGKHKLQLFGFDGSKKQPLWLEYYPPVMLPTQVLNPTNEKEKYSLSKINRKLKRSIENRSNTTLLREKDIFDVVAFHFLSITALVGIAMGLFILVKTMRPKPNLRTMTMM